MPHSEKPTTNGNMSKTNGNTAKTNGNNTNKSNLTNGDRPQSQFINHLTSYPVVSDSISVYKSNPYGAKSLVLFNNAYDTVVPPVTPYLRTPYSFVAPYLAKADSLGDNGLKNLEGRFPIVKEDTSKLKEKALTFYPIRISVEGTDHVFKTYDSEYQRTNGNGIVRQAKAVVSTELKITSELISWIASFLTQKKEESKTILHEKINATQQKINQTHQKVTAAH